MLFFGLLLIVFILAATLSFFDDEDTRLKRNSYMAIVGILVLLAAFRPAGMDSDYDTYVEYYHGNTNQIVEFTFMGIAAVAHALFNSPLILFFVYAVTSICLRGYGIVRSTSFWLLAVVVWMGNFYLYQDLTQIRVAVSSGIFLIAISLLAEKRRGVYITLALLAGCFHYSAFILVALVFLGNKPLTQTGKIIIACIPAIGYILYFMGFDPVMSLPIPWVQDKIEAYEYLRDSGIAGDTINVFNAVYMLRLLVFYVILWKYEILKDQVKPLPLLLKIFALSYFCFTAFSALPVMSFRFAELLGSVEVVLFPCLAFTVRPVAIGRLFVITVAFCCMMINVFYNGLLTFD